MKIELVDNNTGLALPNGDMGLVGGIPKTGDIILHLKGKEVGKLTLNNDGLLEFEGDVAESATVFIATLKIIWRKEVEHVRS